MIFASWKHAEYKWLSYLVYNMQKNILYAYKEASGHDASPWNKKKYFKK